MKNEGPAFGISRRAFLGATTVAAAVALPTHESVAAAQPKEVRGGLIDVNVSLSRWPLRHLPCDNTPALIAKLRRHGVTQAWAGSLDSLLHKDLGAVNARLAVECRQYGRGLLLPFGSVNPKAPDWEEELRRCADVYRMPGIRLYPNYHGYKLDDPALARMLRLAADYRLIVQLALAMEDERAMNPLLRVTPVDPSPLTELAEKIPGIQMVLLNALRILRGQPMRQLLATGRFCVEVATLEGVGGLARLLEQVPLQNVLFGSHAPLFYFESALLKLQESPLNQQQLNAICRENVQRLAAAASKPFKTRQQNGAGAS